MEAAQFALRFHPQVQRFSPRQAAKRHLLGARTSVAHQLAQACFSVRRDQGPCKVEKALG
jgi:hypothetical protein